MSGVTLVKPDGCDDFINPEHVVTVRPAVNGYSVVHTVDGKHVSVRADVYAVIRDLLGPQT